MLWDESHTKSYLIQIYWCQMKFLLVISETKHSNHYKLEKVKHSLLAFWTVSCRSLDLSKIFLQWHICFIPCSVVDGESSRFILSHEKCSRREFTSKDQNFSKLITYYGPEANKKKSQGLNSAGASLSFWHEFLLVIRICKNTRNPE